MDELSLDEDGPRLREALGIGDREHAVRWANAARERRDGHPVEQVHRLGQDVRLHVGPEQPAPERAHDDDALTRVERLVAHDLLPHAQEARVLGQPVQDVGRLAEDPLGRAQLTLQHGEEGAVRRDVGREHERAPLRSVRGLAPSEADPEEALGEQHLVYDGVRGAAAVLELPANHDAGHRARPLAAGCRTMRAEARIGGQGALHARVDRGDRLDQRRVEGEQGLEALLRLSRDVLRPSHGDDAPAPAGSTSQP